MPAARTTLTWLEPQEAFPPVTQAWGAGSDAPGLLAAGGDLQVSTLRHAYSQGIFPWFSEGQPILWWSPDPRMVLQVDQFRLHRSLRKTLLRVRGDSAYEIRFDSAFATVIQACSQTPRVGQSGTWIVPAMVQAYVDMHHAGFAHSVETWINGELAGGLYCVAIGRAVFGESMFTRRPDASKIALAALVAYCKEEGVTMIDCQQKTRHLASLGAAEMDRASFLSHIERAQKLAPMSWVFDPLYWSHILSADRTA